MAGTLFYKTWATMKRRALGKEKQEKYRGIRMSLSNDWHHFEFFKRDMYEAYLLAHEKHHSEGVSIDRINNMEGYSKKNCRWATAKQQARNRRSSVFLTYKGETKTIAEWAEIVGKDQDIIQSRIKRYGWDIEKALETPVKENGGRFKKGHPCYNYNRG